MTVKAIVDEFVRGEYFATWQAEHIDSGGYSRSPFKRDRYERCQDAAEDGADGSTHAEVIDDMREAWRDYLHDRRRGVREYPYRLEAAVLAHFDALEAWHAANGSLEVEIG